MKKRTPLHHKIRSDIESKILSGAWAPGFRIPVEHELMARYGCARMTVNKAITGLVDAGLIVRRKRSGSFVAEPHVQSVILDIADIKADILARGANYSLKLLSREVRVARGVQEKKFAGNGKVIAVECLHMANGSPFALERRLISLSNVPTAVNAEFSETPPGSWLLANVPWTEAENNITAINADLDTAKILNLRPETACLVVERRTWRARADITWVIQTYPGHAFNLVARFSPSSKRLARMDWST